MPRTVVDSSTSNVRHTVKLQIVLESMFSSESGKARCASYVSTTDARSPDTVIQIEYSNSEYRVQRSRPPPLSVRRFSPSRMLSFLHPCTILQTRPQPIHQAGQEAELERVGKPSPERSSHERPPGAHMRTLRSNLRLEAYAHSGTTGQKRLVSHLAPTEPPTMLSNLLIRRAYLWIVGSAEHRRDR
ncbi:hypothetical protein NUW54_g8676 [Trametes sanguinea]|uniref:Uncharacterized protein n=1 Tax=Trametes sanguinea TaxID=158606 RepID=A0ACC1PEC4_9APHY|nr:hypothetical protein NUW54_g8676 [Trametes sanguinea]